MIINTQFRKVIFLVVIFILLIIFAYFLSGPSIYFYFICPILLIGIFPAIIASDYKTSSKQSIFRIILEFF